MPWTTRECVHSMYARLHARMNTATCTFVIPPPLFTPTDLTACMYCYACAHAMKIKDPQKKRLQWFTCSWMNGLPNSSLFLMSSIMNRAAVKMNLQSDNPYLLSSGGEKLRCLSFRSYSRACFSASALSLLAVVRVHSRGLQYYHRRIKFPSKQRWEGHL